MLVDLLKNFVESYVVPCPYLRIIGLIDDCVEVKIEGFALGTNIDGLENIDNYAGGIIIGDEDFLVVRNRAEVASRRKRLEGCRCMGERMGKMYVGISLCIIGVVYERSLDEGWLAK